jgi:hypothetical protein
VRLAELTDAVTVAVDTFGRAVAGDENDADTVRRYYANTGIRLKAAGRAAVRFDHAGKDLERGQRGSSGKNDDVDVVWQLTKAEGGLTAKRTHTRVRWVPESVAFTQEEEPLRHVIAPESWKMGTKECAEALDRLGVPIDASKRAARRALVEASYKVRNDVLLDALKWRRDDLKRSGTTLGTTLAAEIGDRLGDQSEITPLTSGDHFGDHRGPPAQPSGPRSPVPGTGTRTRPVPSVDPLEW